MAEEWRRMAGESTADYAAFLLFRNVGPTRSLRRAYQLWQQQLANYVQPPKGSPRQKPPGSWQTRYRKWEWKRRATCWDVHRMAYTGAQVAAIHTQTVVNVAVKVLKASKVTGPDDAGFAAMLNGMRQVQAFVTPEIVQGIHDHFGHVETAEPAPAPQGDSVE